MVPFFGIDDMDPHELELGQAIVNATISLFQSGMEAIYYLGDFLI
jgi:hypothetical protein